MRAGCLARPLLCKNSTVGVAIGMMIAVSGCSRDYSGAVAAINGNNIQRLANFYADYQAGRTGQGPKSEADLKRFIESQSPETLQRMGLDPNNRDSVWTSERDHKPLKVRYGVDSPFGAVAAIVFEQDGVAGKRQVGFNNTKVEEADESRYKELWEGRGVAKPQPAPGVTDAGTKK